MRYAAEIIGTAAVLCTAVLLQICNYRRLRRTQNENEKLQSLIDARENEYSALISQTDDISCIRHELNKYEWLIAAIERQNREITQTELLKLILAQEAGEAEKAGVCLYAKGELQGNCAIGILDFTSLFMNLLDNAREAAAQTEDGQVNVRIENLADSGADGVRIIIENTKKPDAVLTENSAGGYLTDKPDEKNHGYGTQIVQQIMRRQNGNLSYRDQGDIMTVELWLPVSAGSERTAHL